MPLAWKGERVSKGIVFLLTVMPASSSAVWHSLPVRPARADIHQHQVIVRAAADEPEAVALHPFGQRLRICARSAADML